MKTFLSRLMLTPFFEGPDMAGAGGGGSGAGGGGSQSQQGQGQQGQQGAGAGGGQGQPQFSKFDPNATYDFGDGKPVKGSEYMSRYVPLEKFEKGRDLLLKEADRLEKLYGQFIRPGQRQGQQQQRPPQQQGQRQNPMDRFADRAVIDGPALKEAYQSMLEGDIQPMTQALTHIAQVVKQQQATIQHLQQGYGSITEQHASVDYKRKLGSAIEQLGYDPKLLKEHPVLNELAEDVYLSHDPRDPNLDKEFGPLFKSRVESMIKLVRALDRMKIDEAKNMRRTFTRPGGNAQPGQQTRYQHENGATLARRLFGEVQSST